MGHGPHNRKSDNTLNRTNVELKHITQSVGTGANDAFESNQCGIETTLKSVSPSAAGFL